VLKLASDVNGFIALGVGLIIVGLIWLVFDPEIDDVKDDYSMSTPYLEIMDSGWNAYPLAMLMIGIICALAGIKIQRGGG